MYVYASTSPHFPPRGGQPLALAAAIIATAIPTTAQISCTGSGMPCILTGQYDNQRDAHDSNEQSLLCSSQPCSLSLKQVLMSSGSSPSTLLLVDPSCSGCSNDLPNVTAYIGGVQQTYQAVANPIYAQPLYVPGMTVNSPANSSNCGTSCNMLVAATLNGTVFAWNADTGAQLWSRQGNPNSVVQNSDALWFDDCNAPGYTPSSVPTAGGPLQFIGTVSTPVIDIANVPSGYKAVMYVTSFCRQTNKNTNAKQDFWYLHEIDLSTGLDLCAGGSYNSSNVCSSGGTRQAIEINSSTDAVSVPCSGGAKGCTSGSIEFQANEQNQRPALLEVQNSSTTPNHLIYVAFGGLANSQISPTDTFHGWLLSFTSNSQGYVSRPSPKLQFNTSTVGPDSTNTNQPTCDSTYQTDYYGSTFPYPPNWCGFLGTFWSSTRGPAATPYNALGDSAFDIYLTTGDGPFQYQNSSGGVLSSANGPNWGQSLVRFQLSSQTGMGLSPYQSFTPAGQPQFYYDSSNNLHQSCGPITSISPSTYTTSNYQPCSPAIQPSELNGTCPEDCLSTGCPSAKPWPCQYTFKIADSNDEDMGTSGQILLQDASNNWYVATMDKAGYGYLFKASDLCNGSGCTGTYAGGGANTTYSFSQGDPGNLFPFAASNTLCQNEPTNNKPGSVQTADCDRTTGMAFYNNYLYYWPNNEVNGDGERLIALQLSNWSTQTQFTGTIESWTQNAANGGDGSNDGQTQVVGSATSFISQVIPGDQLVACGCTPPNCPVITAVASNSELTLGQTPACSPSSGPIKYSGYFINPAKDANPPPNYTGYPGGSLTIASSSANSTDGVVFATSTEDNTTSLSCQCSGGTCTATCDSSPTVKTPGGLYAYDATPYNGSLVQLWNALPYSSNNPKGCSSANCPQTYCPSPFALPTVANGRVYLPVYAINNDSTTNCPDLVPSSSYLSGIVAYASVN